MRVIIKTEDGNELMNADFDLSKDEPDVSVEFDDDNVPLLVAMLRDTADTIEEDYKSRLN